jgi:hypothetical protein
MTDQQLFGYILRWVPVAVVLFVSQQLAKRKREVDSDGYPCLRLWGPCFLGLMVGFFCLWMTLKYLDDPFYQRHPENTAVNVFFCVSSFLFGAWSYCYAITLTSTAITRRYLPLLSGRPYFLEKLGTALNLGPRALFVGQGAA